MTKKGRTEIFAVLMLAVSGTANASETPEVFSGDDQNDPYTHLRFQDNASSFQFAIIGDHTARHRSGVLAAAVDILNLLQPEFVMSVGDFIEGYDEDESVLKSQWAEIDELLDQLDMPLFFVPGNHDVNYDPSERIWFERVGGNRSYSHFVYKDVLFLLISTEDPPKKVLPEGAREKFEAIEAGKVRDAEEIQKVVAEVGEWASTVNISNAQVEYFEKVLARHPTVRWTLAFMHVPAWEQSDTGNFDKIEALLADRPYTVFAGHTHTYKYTRRKGHDYLTMGVTGGSVPEDSSVGNMDHVAWLTMTEEGPIISNLLLNGVLDKRGAVPTLQNFLLYEPQ